MSFFAPQNPGIGGLNIFTVEEELRLVGIAALPDPNADRILFWDDSAGAYAYLTIGSGLSITGTTLSSTGGGASALDDLTDVTITTPSSGQLLQYNGSAWVNATVSGTGDVTAASNFGNDNRIIRSDGTGKGVQVSAITLDDSGNLSGVGTLNTHTIPGGTGTLALTSDIPGTPTLDDVLTAGNTSTTTIFISDGSTAETSIDQGAISITDFTSETLILPAQIRLNNGTNFADIVLGTLTGNRTLTIPNQTGTLALEANVAVKSQTIFNSWLFQGTTTDGDYILALKAGFGMTITEVTTKCTSGTATATVKINTTALGGTANSVSSTEQSQSHSSANVVSAGDDIIVTISSASSLTNMSISITATRTLA